MEKRVVITGMGVISSVGNNVETFWNNLKDGVCGIELIDEFPTDDLPVKIAGKVKNFNAEEYGMDKPFIRKQDLFTQYGMAAAWQAMQDAGLHTEGEEQNIDPFRLGVYVGSGIGGFEVQFRETAKMIEDPSGRRISPLFIPTMISNIAAGNIAIKHNAKGPCLDIVTACATSSHCMGEALRAIRHGYADAIIAGGCENATI
ncbi:MAG: beta-ketoacyl-[acyl-carrier-protein] synthase II, partial [Bacteroidales bacterium]|nr:beta-ketoacyl-[acyl-carrier-protein] synthase II [Bacteroidales bacterium]